MCYSHLARDVNSAYIFGAIFKKTKEFQLVNQSGRVYVLDG